MVGILTILFITFFSFDTIFAQTVPLPQGSKIDYGVGGQPTGAVFDSVTNSIWVSNYASSTVSKIDIFTGARVDYPVGQKPFGVAFDNITNSVWVTNYSSSSVSKINIFTGERIDYFVGYGSPSSIIFDNITNSVWLINADYGYLDKIDIFSGSETQYRVASLNSTGSNYGHLSGIAFDYITNSIWVPNSAYGTVSRIDIYSGGKVDYIVGPNIYGATFDDTTKSVWTANSDVLYKIDIYTGAKTSYSANTYRNGAGAVLDRATKSIWLSRAACAGATNSSCSPVLSKVNVLTGAAVDYSTDRYLTPRAFDFISGSIWATSELTNTVSKIAVGGPWPPPQFWSQLQNSLQGWLSVHKTPGTQNKPADNIIKTVPNDWVLKVATTTDTNNNFFEPGDGYRWYGVIDETDGTVGWMEAKNLTDNTEYLSYDANEQVTLAAKATTTPYQTKGARIPVILQAVDNYFTASTTLNSLYGGGGGIAGKNNFQKFIQGSVYPKELVLALAGHESAGTLDNDIVTYDFGHGIMQPTFNANTTNALMNMWDNRGAGSDVTIPLCKSIQSNEYKKCYANSDTVNNLTKPYKPFDGDPANTTYRQYANTYQSIFSNIKDGLRILQDKYRVRCPDAKLTIGQLFYSCQDIEKVLTTWGYNGISVSPKTHYLQKISDALAGLSGYFPGLSYTDIDQLIEKFAMADKHRIEFRKFSPVEIEAVDSRGAVTGFDVASSSIREEIPFSEYDQSTEGGVIFFPQDNYTYRVVGTGTGTYSFEVNSTNDNTIATFMALNLPIAPGEIHTYSIDWDALARGERGVTVNIDTNGDGVVDRSVRSYGTLTEIVPPTITTISPSGDYLLNATTTVQYSVSDDSGIASLSATLNGAPVVNGQVVFLTKPRINTLVVSAMDNEGNTSTATSTFNVLYKTNGFLPPVKSDGSGVYNQGRTLPVKFGLQDANGNIISTATAQIFIAKIINNTVGSDVIPLSTSAADIGNQFRYDLGGHQYIFNLSTNSMPPGAWQLKAVLDNGQEIKTIISIK